MNINKRPKKPSNGHSVAKTEKRIPINFDLEVLDLMATYAMSENAYIKKAGLVNLRNLVSVLDTDLYINDAEKMKRLSFIQKALEARLSLGLKHTDLILKHVSGGLFEAPEYAAELTLLSTEELNFLDNTVSNALKYLYAYNEADNLLNLLLRFKNEDYKTRDSIVGEIEVAIQSLQTCFRRSKVESSADTVFSLRQDKFDNVLEDIYTRAINPSRKLLTGMKGMNLLTNGGFEAGRVYGFFGATGIGKSMTLLNLAYQIKKYNRHYKPKDPTKTPVIVVLTMENDVDETVKRLYSIATGASHDEFQRLSYAEIKQRLIEDGELYLSDDSPLDILVKYKPSGSVDTTYMYQLVEELEDDGYETVCFIQDHLKKIRSAQYRNAELRIELGEVVNEMKAFAQIKDIPVITCSHLNRDACAKLDAASQSSKADLVRMLGKANVGESLLILDNIDFGFLINKEYDNAGMPYMCVLTSKKRDFTPLDYAALPFDPVSGIKLIEDFYSNTPAFKESLGGVNEIQRKDSNKSAYINSAASLFVEDEEDDDIFSKGRRFNAMSIPPIELTADITVDEEPIPEPITYYIPSMAMLKPSVKFGNKMILS